MKNKRINLEKRMEIYCLLDKDKNLRKIANFLKRSVSSISEEIKQGREMTPVCYRNYLLL